MLRGLPPRALLPLALVLLAPGCRRPAAPAPAPEPTVSPTRLGAADVAMVAAVVRAERESRAEAARRAGARVEAVARGEPLPLDPLPTPTDPERLAAALGHDPQAYLRGRRRIEDVLFLHRLRGESEATRRFRQAHRASLVQSIEAATADEQRLRLQAVLQEVEEGERRDGAEDERRFGPDFAADLALIEAHAEELGVRDRLGR